MSAISAFRSILQRLQAGGAYTGQEGTERLLGRDGVAQHQGVDKEAHQGSQFGALAPRRNGAQRQVGLAAVAVEQYLRQGQHQHERSGAGLFGQGAQAAAGGGVKT